ncbi:MAG: hypothetical protein ACPG66_03940 [Flavobacteriales bacterium]
MKQLILKTAFAAAFVCVAGHGMAQVTTVTANQMDYLDNSTRENFRTPSSGDINIVVNTTLNNSLFFDDQVGDLVNQDLNGVNRLAEQFIPSFRYYLSSRNCVSAGLLLGRKNQTVSGTTLNIDTNDVKTMEMTSQSRSLSLRVAFDHHNQPMRFRHFDLDTYFGAALSVGRTKAFEYLDATFVGGDYLHEEITTPGSASGGELYTGVALRFDRVSIGAELLAIGFDRQSGFGISEVTYDQRINNVIESGTYLAPSGELPFQFQGANYSALTATSSRTSMYKGVRLNVVLHL